MAINIEKLFKEALALYNQKKYYQAREVLEVLVKEDFKPAISLMESTEQKIKNKEAVAQESTEQKIINKEVVDQESSQEIKQEPIKYTKPKPQFNFRKKKKFNFAFLFDPTNKIWLNFVLIFFFILEGIILVSAIILSIVYSSLLYFLYSIIGIVVLHVLTMIGLNMIFNIQAIKDDIKELKNKR